MVMTEAPMVQVKKVHARVVEREGWGKALQVALGIGQGGQFAMHLALHMHLSGLVVVNATIPSESLIHAWGRAGWWTLNESYPPGAVVYPSTIFVAPRNMSDLVREMNATRDRLRRQVRTSY